MSELRKDQLADQTTAPPELLHLTLHRAYFLVGLLSFAYGLLSMWYHDDTWSGFFQLLCGVLFLVSSYQQRIELRTIVAVGLIALFGAAIHEMVTEDYFSWKDMRRPGLQTAIFCALSLLSYWVQAKQELQPASQHPPAPTP